MKFTTLVVSFLCSVTSCFASSDLRQWSTTCEKGQCAVSFFFSARAGSPYLEGGIIFVSNQNDPSMRLRVLAPLGANLQKGISIDLGAKLLGNLAFNECSKLGCVADTGLRPGDIVNLLSTSHLGVTVWDEGNRAFRSIVPVRGLREALTQVLNTKTQTSDLVASLHGDILPSYLAGQATVSFVGNGEEGCPSQADQKFTFQVNDKALINEYFDSIARQSAHYFSLTDGKSDVSDKVKLAAERETGGLLATDLTSMVNDASFRDIRVLVGKGGGPSSIANCKKLVLHWSAGGGSQEEPEAGTAKAIIRNASFTLYDASGKALNRFPIESKQLGKSDATGAILAGDTEYQKLLPLSSVILARELQNGSGKSVEIKY